MAYLITNPAFAMLYLCACVLSNKKPDVARLSEIDLKSLYEVSKFHYLTALVCEALEHAEIVLTEENQKYITDFRKAREKSVRKNIMLDTERSKIIAFMEQNSIWYMPLKGVILKDMYPKLGLRQMADNDILFDETHREAVMNWFSGQGYEVESYAIGDHDVYLKNPIYNYEMHTSLYGTLYSSKWQDYYKTVKARLVKDECNGYGYHFTDEDFYIYFLTHGFKHFDNGGTGFRFICDLYVYLKAKQEEMDLAYISKELHTLELTDFEKDCRELVSEIFGNIHAFDFEKLSQAHKDMLTYFLSSGAYGTAKQRVQNGICKRGKFKYLIWRIFPGTRVLEKYHPVFKHKLLVPVGWIYRGFVIITSHGDRATKAMREINTIIKTKRK